MSKEPQPGAAKLGAELEEARRRIAALEAASTGGALRSFTDSLTDAFSLLSPEGVHLDVNPALCAMTGFTRDELLGTGPPHPYWPPEERAAIGAVLGDSLDGSRVTRAATFVRKNGERFPVLITPSLLRDEHGVPVSLFTTFRDISELRRAQAALAESEELFRLTFEQAPIGAALVGRDFRFRRVNERLAQMTGYTADELLERGFPDITHPDDVTADVAEVRRLAAGEIDEYAREKRYVRKDGGVVWAEVIVRPLRGSAGEVVAFVAQVTDISERKHAEHEAEVLLAAVESERRRLAGLLDSIPDEIWFADAQGRFTLANPAALRQFGTDAAAGTAVGDLAARLEVRRADGSPRPPGEAPPLRALRGEQVRNLEEIVRVPSSGELRHRLVTATPVEDERGQIAGCVSVVRDVTDLRHAEEALARERERAQRYLDIAEVMLVAIGPDQRVLFANRKACQVLERGEHDVIGSNWFETSLPEEGRETVAMTFAQLMADNVPPWEYFENHIVTAGGEERLIAWRNTVLRDEAGAIVATLSSGEDITERRHMERLLAAPAEILAAVAHADSLKQTVGGVVAALQRATGLDAVGLRLKEGEDYPFLGALGYSDEFLRAEDSLVARYPEGGLCRDPDGLPSLECTCGLVVRGRTDPADPLFTAGGSAWTNDSLPLLQTPPEQDPRLNPRNRCIHAGFRSIALVPLRAGNEILGLLHLADRRPDRFTPETIAFFEGLGASIGLSLARTRAERAVRESETRYRIVAENTYDWEWWTAPDGHYVYVSEGCLPITGHTPDEFLADPGLLMAVTHADDREAVAAHLRQGATDEADLHEVVFRVLTPTGDTHVVEHRCSAVYGDDGLYLGRRGSNRDITERRRAEEEIRRLNDELRERIVGRTEQLEAATRELEALAYAMAHDVRAPLRSIDGFSALVMEDEADRLSPEGAANLRRVRAAAQTLARLMDELMGLSKVGRRELLREPLDLTALALEVGAEEAAEHPGRDVTLLVQPRLRAEADARLVRIILRELLRNAWKFTAPHRAARVEVGATETDGEPAFFVRDDGVGFDMHYAQHLFGVFQRMHSADQFEGDGVGLATVQRLVRRHNGRCWATAEPEKGATICFTLPPAQAAG